MTGSNIKISIKNGSVNQIMKSHIFTTNFSSIYPLYVQKAEKKNRTKKEVDEIICWLTGYDLNTLEKQLNNHVDFATFFNQAPQINPNSSEIKGKVCGVQVEEIEDRSHSGDEVFPCDVFVLPLFIHPAVTNRYLHIFCTSSQFSVKYRIGIRCFDALSISACIPFEM